MKKLILLVFGIIVVLAACQKKNNVPHYYISPALKATFGYGVGSYWIYKDSISGEIDSFYVYYSSAYTNHNPGEDDDIMVIALKRNPNNSSDSEKWSFTLTDSLFNIAFVNSNDLTESQIKVVLFTYPFKIQNLNIIGEDSGYISNVYPNLPIGAQQYPNTAVSHHKNVFNRIPYIQYDDVFYVSSNSGIVKLVFQHPQDSVQRVLELQRYNIVK